MAHALASPPQAFPRPSEPPCESTCPTALQLLDLPWWGRRFRLPITGFNRLFPQPGEHADRRDSFRQPYGATLKKNGSIETSTGVFPSTSNSTCFAVSQLRWNVTPAGKFAGFGVLFAEKIP